MREQTRLRCSKPAIAASVRSLLALVFVLCATDVAVAQGEWSTNGNDIRNTNIGSVGVGTNAPSGLQITVPVDETARGVDNIRFGVSLGTPRIIFEDSASATQHEIDNLNGTMRFFRPGIVSMSIDSNGNIGIGTTNPPYRLTVDNTVDNSTLANIRIRALSTRYRSDLTVGNTGLGINAYDDTAAAYLPITIDASKTILGMQGNVGIGTTNPTVRLHVEGDLHANGAITGASIRATYQDIAEWVAAREGALSAGTVVILDPEQTNQVMASVRAYDTSVAGVVSAQPGLALGEAATGRVLVATMGRVRVRVDATRAPIRVGDLLVTSDTPGVAMRSFPLDLGGTPIHRPGTLIGKALEPLERGTGEILVLLSLQ